MKNIELISLPLNGYKVKILKPLFQKDTFLWYSENTKKYHEVNDRLIATTFSTKDLALTAAESFLKKK